MGVAPSLATGVPKPPDGVGEGGDSIANPLSRGPLQILAASVHVPMADTHNLPNPQILPVAIGNLGR